MRKHPIFFSLATLLLGFCNDQSSDVIWDPIDVLDLLSNSTRHEGKVIEVLGCLSSRLAISGIENSGYILYGCGSEIGLDNFIILNFESIPAGLELSSLINEELIIQGFFSDTEVTGVGQPVVASFLEFAKISAIK